MTNRPDISPIHQQLFDSTRSASMLSNTTQHTPFGGFVEATNRKLHSANMNSAISYHTNSPTTITSIASESDSNIDVEEDETIITNQSKRKHQQTYSKRKQQQNEREPYSTMDKRAYEKLKPHMYRQPNKNVSYFNFNFNNKYVGEEEQYYKNDRPHVKYNTRSRSAAHVHEPHAYRRRANSYSRALKLPHEHFYNNDDDQQRLLYSSATPQPTNRKENTSQQQQYKRRVANRGANRKLPSLSMLEYEEQQQHELEELRKRRRASASHDLLKMKESDRYPSAHEADYLDHTVVLDVNPAFYLAGSIRVVEVVNDLVCWTAEYDGMLRIRTIPEGHIVKQIEGRQSTYCTSLLFVPETNELWAAFQDGYIRVYNVETNKLVQEMVQHRGSVRCLLLLEGNVYSGGDDFKINEWSAHKRTFNRLFYGHGGGVRCLSAYCGITGSVLFSGSDDATIKAWNPYAPLQIHVETRKASITSINTSNNNNKEHVNNESVNTDNTTPTTNNEELACLYTFTGHIRSVTSLATIQPYAGQRRQQLWSGGEDTTIRIWNLSSLECDAILTVHDAPISCFLQVERRMWSADKHGHIVLWELNSLTPLQELSRRMHGIQLGMALHLCKVQKCELWKIWSTGSNGFVQVWNAEVQPLTALRGSIKVNEMGENSTTVLDNTESMISESEVNESKTKNEKELYNDDNSVNDNKKEELEEDTKTKTDVMVNKGKISVEDNKESIESQLMEMKDKYEALLQAQREHIAELESSLEQKINDNEELKFANQALAEKLHEEQAQATTTTNSSNVHLMRKERVPASIEREGRSESAETAWPVMYDLLKDEYDALVDYHNMRLKPLISTLKRARGEKDLLISNLTQENDTLRAQLHEINKQEVNRDSVNVDNDDNVANSMTEEMSKNESAFKEAISAGPSNSVDPSSQTIEGNVIHHGELVTWSFDQLREEYECLYHLYTFRLRPYIATLKRARGERDYKIGKMQEKVNELQARVMELTQAIGDIRERELDHTISAIDSKQNLICILESENAKLQEEYEALYDYFTMRLKPLIASLKRAKGERDVKIGELSELLQDAHDVIEHLQQDEIDRTTTAEKAAPPKNSQNEKNKQSSASIKQLLNSVEDEIKQNEKAMQKKRNAIMTDGDTISARLCTLELALREYHTQVSPTLHNAHK